MFRNSRIDKTLKITLLVIALALCAPLAEAQQSTYSPYSRYGYGILNEPNFGNQGAMGGVTAAMREVSNINPMNPASYSAIDSTTFIFDFAFTGTHSLYEENGVTGKAYNFALDHIAMKFPIAKNWGFSVGLYEFSQTGYSFYDEIPIAGLDGEDDTYAISAYSSTGGINNLFVGTAYRFFNHLSVGFNWNYRFGTLQYLNVLTYPESSEYTKTYTYYMLELGQSAFQFGLQYEQTFADRHRFVLGGSLTLPADFDSQNYNMVLVEDTTYRYYDYKYSTPTSFSVGLSYTYDNRLTIAADYRQQNWSDATYFSRTDTLATSRRLSLGVEYLPRFLGENYFQVIKYRAGLHYSDSYIKFAGQNLREIGFSLGFGLPIHGSRSVLNLSLESDWTLTPRPDQIQEYNLKLCVGILFNESWFVKRRFN